MNAAPRLTVGMAQPIISADTIVVGLQRRPQ
jgi:hypothetical protein